MAVIFENFQGNIIQLIEIFCLKINDINLNRFLDTIVLDIYYIILIDFIYNIFIEEIVVSFLNIKVRSKKNLEIVNF